MWLLRMNGLEATASDVSPSSLPVVIIDDCKQAGRRTVKLSIVRVVEAMRYGLG